MSSSEGVSTSTVAIGNGAVVAPSDNEHSRGGVRLPREKEVASESTPDLIRKANIPVVLVQGEGEGEEDRENEVKVKPNKGHTRGSSVSSAAGSHGQCETTSNTSNSSLTNSVSSSRDDQMGETISLPIDLSQMKESTNRTVSDPALIIAASLKGQSDGEKDETISRLIEEIVSLKMEIMQIKEENKHLKKTRTDMDHELHALTENLFEEAYKMVDEAKGERFTAEKRLADAAGQIEAMETQVSTLHSLLKTPSKVSPSQKHKKPSVKKMIRKLSRKGHSSSKLKEMGPLVTEHKGNTREWILKEGEIPSSDFSVFNEWFQQGLPSTPGSHAFFDSILSSNIQPCLQFVNEELSKKIHKAIIENTLILEPFNELIEEGSTPERKCCELSRESDSTCKYRLQLEKGSNWYYISSNCRGRIVSVCDFYTFVGYFQKGIIKKDAEDVYWRIAKYRAVMNISCLCLSLPDS